MNQQTLLDAISDEVSSIEQENGISESEFGFLNSLKDFISERLSKVGSTISGKAPAMIQKAYPAPNKAVQGIRAATDERSIVQNSISAGNVNENGLTDLVFYSRYPQLKNIGIQRTNPAYSQLSTEWISIRNNIVRPVIASKSQSVNQPRVAVSGLSSLRQRVVTIATAECHRWRNGSLVESNSQMHPAIEEYWATGVGVNIRNQQRDFWNIPWSAAFISYVMRQAGVSGFRFSGAHIEYCIGAKNNRVNNTGQVKAYRVTEVQPQLGDIVVARRSDSIATYENMASGMKTHGDIVVSRTPGNIEVIGGNVSQSVKKKSLPLDARGYLRSSSHFTIIKID